MTEKQMISHHKISIAESELSITLPRSVAAQAGLSEHDWVEFVRCEDGVRLQPADPELSEQMAIAERVMNENKSLMNRLANS